jgi:hypothetical protein
MLRYMLAATLAAALALSACDTREREIDEQKRVGAVVEGWYEALVTPGRGDAACATLTEAGRRRLVAEMAILGLFSCRKVADRFASDIGEADRAAVKRMRVRRVSLSGSRALVRDDDVALSAALVGQSKVNGRPTVLQRVGDTWRIEDLG